ncbi:hypothetical protein R6Q57_001260 [Mikania cordata]
MNPRPNNPNPEFNPFSYDPESLRNLLVQLQQNPNIQHFQQHPPNFQPPSNFQPGFAPYSQPRFESDFVSPSQHDNEVLPETQDTQKRKNGKKNKQPAGTGPSSGPMAPKQWTHDEEIALGRCYIDESENKTKGSSKRTKNFESNEYSPGGSTAHTNYAVNLEDDEEEAKFDTPPEPVRPMGRDTTKRASSSSHQTVSSNPTTTDLADQLQAFTTFQKQKHEDKKKMHEEKTLRADLRAMNFQFQKIIETEKVIISEVVSFVLMNNSSEYTPENGYPRRKSISSTAGSNLSGEKARRYSIGVTNSQKSIGEEGKIVPNYLRASTGSCHDFCKFGKKHELSKSAIPVKFKRTTIVNKDKRPNTVVSLEEKNTKIKPSIKPETRMLAEPVKVTKNDALLPSNKLQAYKHNSLTNGTITTKSELKTFQRSASLVKSSPVVVEPPDRKHWVLPYSLIREGPNGRIEKKDTKTVKKTGITPKMGTVKKVVEKVSPNESQSLKGSFGRAASLKVTKSRGIKQVLPLKDQNRMQKEHTIDENVQTISLHGVEAETEIKPEIMKFDFIQPSLELINPPVCNSHDPFSDKNIVVVESPIIHPVNESSELFSDKDVVEELYIVESLQLQSCSDREILKEEALITPSVSKSSESLYDDEVLDNESDYTDNEEAEASSETVNAVEMGTSVGNHKISRKGKMVISKDRDDEAVKLRFRRGKVVDLQSENNSPRRLKFRTRVLEGKQDSQNISRKTCINKTLDLQNEEEERSCRKFFEKKYVKETNDSQNGPESVVLKHQGEQEKKDAQGLLNNVIEETASKLVESRKSKVKALVGAFETVISLQDGLCCRTCDLFKDDDLGAVCLDLNGSEFEWVRFKPFVWGKRHLNGFQCLNEKERRLGTSEWPPPPPKWVPIGTLVIVAPHTRRTVPNGQIKGMRSVIEDRRGCDGGLRLGLKRAATYHSGFMVRTKGLRRAAIHSKGAGIGVETSGDGRR